MNDRQQQVLKAIMDLFDRLQRIENINNVDELRLIVIQKRVEDINTIIDDFGKKWIERFKQ